MSLAKLGVTTDPPESGVWYHGDMKGKDRRVKTNPHDASNRTTDPAIEAASDAVSDSAADSNTSGIAVAEAPGQSVVEIKSPLPPSPPSPSEALRGRRKAAEPPAPVTPELTRALEAILISTDRPVSLARLSEALAGCEALTNTSDRGSNALDSAAMPAGLSVAEPIPMGRVKAAIEALNRQYEETGRVFRVQPIAGGFRLMTVPSVARVLESFHGARQRASLSRAAIESLAILAYRQPLTRAKLEAIRGVACGEILRSLTERRLVTVVGRAEELGRPLLYGTTKQFLEAFGLSSIKDLPTVEEFKARTAGGDDDDE